MRIDAYTKVVLTVIAVCLVALVLKPLVLPTPSRADDVMSVRIVGTAEPLATNLAAVAGEELVLSQYGSSIGFSRGEGKMSRIHWGSITETQRP